MRIKMDSKIEEVKVMSLSTLVFRGELLSIVEVGEAYNPLNFGQTTLRRALLPAIIRHHALKELHGDQRGVIEILSKQSVQDYRRKRTWLPQL
eukprot:2140443-Amphidinium_carterae.1